MRLTLISVVLVCLSTLLQSGCQSDRSPSQSQSNAANDDQAVVITETRAKRMPLELSLLSLAMDVIGFSQPSSLNDAFYFAFGVIGSLASPIKKNDAIDANGVNTLYFSPQDVDSKRAIIYIHGGGYQSNYVSGHVQYAQHLSQHNNAHVFFPEYTQSGKVTYPTSIDNVFKVYQHVINTLGYEPKNVVVMGDSAGGNATLSLMVRIRSEGETLPGAAVTFSAWADLTSTADTYETNKDTDVSLSKERLQAYAERYVSDTDVPLTHPEVSPALADFSGFPALLIFVSVDEVLLGDSDRVFEQAKKANVDVSYFKYSALNGRLPHAWQMMNNTGELGDDVNQEVTSFINTNTAQ